VVLVLVLWFDGDPTDGGRRGRVGMDRAVLRWRWFVVGNKEVESAAVPIRIRPRCDGAWEIAVDIDIMVILRLVLAV